MAKKIFATPFLFNPITPPPDVTDSGAGSGQSGQKPWWTYEKWLEMDGGDWCDLGEDDPVGDENDYVAWWYANGFSPEAFKELNGYDLPEDPRP